jgi:hypothetical protein
MEPSLMTGPGRMPQTQPSVGCVSRAVFCPLPFYEQDEQGDFSSSGVEHYGSWMFNYGIQLPRRFGNATLKM